MKNIPFYKSAVNGKNMKWECFVNLIHEKYRVESSRYFFNNIKLEKSRWNSTLISRVCLLESKKGACEKFKSPLKKL